MMAAIRILIWFAVKVVRRSSISNMASSPWRMFAWSPGGAYAPAVMRGYRDNAVGGSPAARRHEQAKPSSISERAADAIGSGQIGKDQNQPCPSGVESS